MPLDLTGSNLFFVLVLFGAGLFCIMKGGDLFVDAATWIAESTGIPKFIIGATVVSFATTMPELLVSLFSAFEGNADIAVGNAVGSVTANTGLILCISLVCMQCAMTRRQYAGKACLLLAAICLLFVFTRDGSISLWESAVILAVFVFYMAGSLLAGRREQGAEQPAEKPKKDGRTVAWNIGKFVVGAAAIVLGAQLLIDNGSELARRHRRAGCRYRRHDDRHRHLAAGARHDHHFHPQKAGLALCRQYHRREHPRSDAHHAAVRPAAGPPAAH